MKRCIIYWQFHAADLHAATENCRYSSWLVESRDCTLGLLPLERNNDNMSILPKEGEKSQGGCLKLTSENRKALLPSRPKYQCVLINFLEPQHL